MQRRLRPALAERLQILLVPGGPADLLQTEAVAARLEYPLVVGRRLFIRARPEESVRRLLPIVRLGLAQLHGPDIVLRRRPEGVPLCAALPLFRERRVGVRAAQITLGPLGIERNGLGERRHGLLAAAVVPVADAQIVLLLPFSAAAARAQKQRHKKAHRRYCKLSHG